MISLNNYLKERFGCKVYKLSLDGGFTCPNRDGTVGTGGCIFCSSGGSGEFAGRGKDIREQLSDAKSRVNQKIKNGKYIAYLQAFTNTYAPCDKLKDIYLAAIDDADVVALSIATRPDCLGDDVIELISYINSIKPVFVELGLQTIHKKTAEYIRRGYELAVYDEAVRKLRAIGVSIVTHIILGLPGESTDDMYQSVKYADMHSDGIKLQLLHVLKGTDLEKDYLNGKFECLSLDKYTQIITHSLSLLSDKTVVHRITGDGDKKILVAPLWSADKKRVLNTLNKAISAEGLVL